MKAAERRLIEAALDWWRTNRYRTVRADESLWEYYQQDDVVALVGAAADVASSRGED
jgi:hypothetical protein